MLSAEDNELLSRTGPGTLMGDLMREYWIPAFLTTELPAPDSPPLRLRLLGENLIGFRVTSGKVGLIQNNCPHRGASLFFGRNEEEGLRCVYHGWKYDVTGQCVDMPSEPPESNFKTKVRARAFPCVERNGVVYTYMGTRETPPPLPDIEANMIEGCDVQKVVRDCNWVQGLEGDIDTGHLGFLHFGSVDPSMLKPGTMDYYTVADRCPRYNVIDTDFGTSYGAYRPAEEDSYYWRFAHFLFPFYSMIPTGVLGQQVLARAWIPIDDEHMMFWSMMSPETASALTSRPRDASADETEKSDGGSGRGAGFSGLGWEYLPDTSDWIGRFRINQNKANDYLIDREAQRTRDYTGIPGIHQQDQAITESMGTIVDRAEEHLGSSDAMVIRTRIRLLNAAKALRENGVAPPGVDNPEVYRYRSGGVILPRNVDWLEATKELRKGFVEHKPEDLYAPMIKARA